MDKWSSFSSKNNNVVVKEKEKEAVGVALAHVVEEVDRFLDNHDSHNNKSGDVPECVIELVILLDSMIDKYKTQSQSYRNYKLIKFGQEAEDDKCFLDALDRISKLSCCTSLVFLSSGSTALDKISCVLERAMRFLENGLCAHLQPQDPNPKYEKTHKKSSSFGSLHLSDLDLGSIPEDESSPGPRPNSSSSSSTSNHQQYDQQDLLAFSPQKVSILNKMATTLIAGGYQAECCMAFANFRKSAFKSALQSFGYTCSDLRMEDIYKMQWESLEGEIATWNKLVRHCTTVLFNAERRLYDSVFPNYQSVSHKLFTGLARAVIIYFLNFAQAAILTKRSAEKLFKFLDMYETLRDVEAGILDNDDSYLSYETVTAKDRIVEASISMFCDLENSIKSDNERIPVPNGAVHPLTRYVMNYLKYACEYKDTLEQVFRRSLDVKGMMINNNNYNEIIDDHHKSCIQEVEDQVIVVEEQEAEEEEEEEEEKRGKPKKSPFAVQLMTIMELLDANVERKSRLYRDPALRYVFLMNNGRYIAQKIKGCAELHKSMGDNWCRRKKSGLRLYHKNYQRETWNKLLQCLNLEGLQGNGNKLSKLLIKERFKCFNAMFEEIHKTQSTWVVSDEQLQSELRVSISALVIPAYRSFVGRFKHHLDSTRHVDKYIKYHPDDIETLIHDLFAGNATSMARKRT